VVSHDSIYFFWHLSIKRPEASLYMHQILGPLAHHHRASERGVGVAIDDDDVGPQLLEGAIESIDDSGSLLGLGA
jgi:hypothetical protein